MRLFANDVFQQRVQGQTSTRDAALPVLLPEDSLFPRTILRGRSPHAFRTLRRRDDPPDNAVPWFGALFRSASPRRASAVPTTGLPSNEGRLCTRSSHGPVPCSTRPVQTRVRVGRFRRWNRLRVTKTDLRQFLQNLRHLPSNGHLSSTSGEERITA